MPSGHTHDPDERTGDRVAPPRAYWVTCTGDLQSDEGISVNVTDPEIHTFVKALTKELLKGAGTHNPAVLTYGDGSMVLVSVFFAEDKSAAVAAAEAAFGDAIRAAGGSTEFPDGSPCWRVARLLRYGTLAVKEVPGVAAA